MMQEPAEKPSYGFEDSSNDKFAHMDKQEWDAKKASLPQNIYRRKNDRTKPQKHTNRLKLTRRAMLKRRMQRKPK